MDYCCAIEYKTTRASQSSAPQPVPWLIHAAGEPGPKPICGYSYEEHDTRSAASWDGRHPGLKRCDLCEAQL